MSKKIISLLLVLTLVFSVAMLAGCQKKSNVLTSNFEIPEGGYDGSAVTITFYHTMGATDGKQDVLNHYIAEFNKLYPNITIVHEQVGGYDDVRDQIKTELTVGNQPNIAYCYPDHVALYNVAKAVVTLDDLINSKIEVKHADGTAETLGMTQEQQDDFIKGFYEEGRQFGDGLMYTLPFSKSTEVFFYNKTFFEANDLTVPSTWDELKVLCEKIKAIDPECIPMGYDSESNWFITMCEQYGSPYTSATGDHFIFNNDQNKAFVKEFREWYQKEYVTTQEIYGGYTSGLFTATTGKRSYMGIGSSAGASHQLPDLNADGEYPFEVGIAPIPQVDPANPKVISQGPSLCIFKDSNPQEVIASWLFVKYLTTNVDFQAAFADVSGYVPVLKSVANHPVYAEKMAAANGAENITYLSAKVCMEQQAAYYTSPAFNGSSDARDQVGILMQAAFTGEDGGDLDAMLDRIFKEAVDECNK